MGAFWLEASSWFPWGARTLSLKDFRQQLNLQHTYILYYIYMLYCMFFLYICDMEKVACASHLSDVEVGGLVSSGCAV